MSAVQGHRQRGQQDGPVDVGHVAELEALVAPDRFGRLLGRRGVLLLGKQQQGVVGLHQAAAPVDDAQGFVPIRLLVLGVGHQRRHLRDGVLGRPRLVHHHHGLGAGRVREIHAHGQQERTGILQRGLGQIADQAPMRARLKRSG
jgi:hypothetical protein